MQVGDGNLAIEDSKFPTLVDLFRPKTYITLGAKGAGKSEIGEKNGCDLYAAGWLGLDTWGVQGESFFWSINFDHEKDHQLRLSLDPNQKGKKHCGCNRAYPILVLAPNSVKFDQSSIDKFNGFAIKSKQQHIDDCRRNGIFPIEWNNNMIGQRRENKGKPLFKVAYLPEPSHNGSNHESFVEQFTKYLLEGRSEGRVCVFNPQIWEHEAARFKAVDLFLRSLEAIKYKHFTPAPMDLKIAINAKFKERGYLTLTEWRQYNQDKMFILIRELGELAASQLKAYQSSTMSKRGILLYIRRARHNGITSLWDLQNPEDCFSSIRNQADVFFIKRAQSRLLGQEWTWLYKEIDGNREWVKKKYQYAAGWEREADRMYKKIENLDVNQVYVISDDNTPKLRRVSTPYFHHKQQSEHFGQLTGITWIEITPTNTKRIEMESMVGQPKELRSAASIGLIDLIKSFVNPKEAGGKDMTLKKAYEEIMQMAEGGKIPKPGWNSVDAMRIWFKRNNKQP